MAESEETLTLALANPSGAALEDAQATGTIADAGEPAPAAVPLTASFTDAPSAHAGSGTFTFRILFSEPVGIGYRTLRDESLAAVGGTVRRAKRVDGRSDLWEIEVEPDGLAGVVVTLAGGRACATAGAVCTKNGKPLSATVSLTVRGPAALSVADARAKEGTDPTIDFAVTLDRAASGTVTVDYATSDGTAVAGADYTRAVGTLTFAAGEKAGHSTKMLI